MGACFWGGLGDKAKQSICDCKYRCDGWFPDNVQLRDGCYAACQGNSSNMKTKEDYTCGKPWSPSRDSLILAYQYDPCKTSANDKHAQEVFDPLGFNKTEAAKNTAAGNSNTSMYIGLGLLLILLLISMLKN